jgi:hypothetical protein
MGPSLRRRSRPYRGHGRQVLGRGRQSRVLPKWPSSSVNQIGLKISWRLVADVRAIDHYPHVELLLQNGQAIVGTGDARCERPPLSRLAARSLRSSQLQ